MFNVKIVFDNGEQGKYIPKVQYISNTDDYICLYSDGREYQISIDEHLSGVVIYFDNKEDANGI